MSESARTRTYLANVRRAHPDAFVWKVSDRVTSGIPDVFIAKDGRTIMIEFKHVKPENLGTALSMMQKHQLKKLAQAGVPVYVATFTKDGYKVFDHHLLPSPQGTYELRYLEGR